MTHRFHSVPPHRCAKNHARRCTFRSQSEWVVWEVAVEEKNAALSRIPVNMPSERQNAQNRIISKNYL